METRYGPGVAFAGTRTRSGAVAFSPDGRRAWVTGHRGMLGSAMVRSLRDGLGIPIRAVVMPDDEWLLARRGREIPSDLAVDREALRRLGDLNMETGEGERLRTDDVGLLVHLAPARTECGQRGLGAGIELADAGQLPIECAFGDEVAVRIAAPPAIHEHLLRRGQECARRLDQPRVCVDGQRGRVRQVVAVIGAVGGVEIDNHMRIPLVERTDQRPRFR